MSSRLSRVEDRSDTAIDIFEKFNPLIAATSSNYCGDLCPKWLLVRTRQGDHLEPLGMSGQLSKAHQELWLQRPHSEVAAIASTIGRILRQPPIEDSFSPTEYVLPLLSCSSQQRGSNRGNYITDRQVDPLTPTAPFSAKQCSDNAANSRHRSVEIAAWKARHGRRTACHTLHPQGSGERLIVQIVPGLVGEWATLTVARQAAENDVVFRSPKSLVAKPQSPHNAGTKLLNNNVAVLDHAQENRLAFVTLEID